MNTELIASWRHHRVIFGDVGSQTVVGEVDGQYGIVVVKGQAEIEELEPGKPYRFFGEWSEYVARNGRAERQFAFTSFCPSLPLDHTGIITYLCRVGEGRRLGPSRAMDLWERHGQETLDVIAGNPEALVEVGVPRQHAEEIVGVLAREKRTEQATVELMGLFAGRGLPRALPRQCIVTWGTDAARQIKRDPYRLMRFRGVGFDSADKLYLAFGGRPERLRRQLFRLWDKIERDNQGSTWTQAQQAVGATQIKRASTAIKMGLRLAKRRGWEQPHGKLAGVSTIGPDGPIADGNRGSVLWLATSNDAAAERSLASMVALAATEHPQWPDPAILDGIDDHQRQALDLALRGRIAILGGSPGTGKTFTAARLIRECSERLGPGSVAIAAPTGKAAVRITEAMRAAGVTIQARTWHSLLGVGAGGGFKHCETSPLPHSLIISDESSMIDTNLMRAAFAARGKAHLLLVGDVNQLPPVGTGAPLRDMIAAGLPYGELREIKRNSGGIVEACAAIRDCVPWDAGDNLHILEGRITVQTIHQQIERAAAELDVDPVWGCQVVVATNDKGQLSRKALNEQLQVVLNSRQKQDGARYAVGDKVICLENGAYTAARVQDIPDEYREDYDQEETDAVKHYCANGEMGQVIATVGKMVILRLDSPTRYVKVSQGASNWDLAYAITVHKSQGSEWPCVIVLLDPSAYSVCDRSWLYTAISRAKMRCILIGDKMTADRFCRKASVNQRKTFLAEQIARESARLNLVGI